MNWEYEGEDMSEQANRKRAVCKMPLTVIEDALGLNKNQLLIAMNQTYEDMRDGVVELLVTGDGLDDHFLTPGPARQGAPKFYEENGTVQLWVVPPEQPAPEAGPAEETPEKPEPETP